MSYQFCLPLKQPMKRRKIIANIIVVMDLCEEKQKRDTNHNISQLNKCDE